MRMLALGVVIVFVAGACSSERVVRDEVAHGVVEGVVRSDFCCTEAAGTPADAAERCAAQQCQYGPQLICRGTQAPPEDEEREREARQRCRVSCACTCPEDVRLCASQP